MKGEPGALPLMSFALRDLFEAEKTKKGEPMDLTLPEYLQRGGIESALERHANQVFNDFSDEQKALAQNVFSKLIEIGQGRVDTRRTAAFAELVPANANADAVAAVVARLAAEDVRLITTSGVESGEEITEALTTQVTVTLSHEKLIDAWPWLRRLVDENREIIALQNQINSDAQAWSNGNDAGFLYRGGRLLQIEEHIETLRPNLDALSLRFIQASINLRQAEEREKEAARLRELENSQRLAEAESKARAEAEARAKENEESATKLRQRLLYVGVALIIALIATGVAIFTGSSATRQRDIAEEASTRAVEGEATAVAAQNKAVAAQTEAEKQASLALSSALVTKAQNVGDEELRLLLAVEAIRATTDGESPPEQAAVKELQKALSTGLEKALTISADNSGAVAENRGTLFSADGEYLALQRGTYPGTAKLLDIQTSEVVNLPSEMSMIDYFAFGPAGKYIAASGETSVHLLDAESTKAVCTPPLQQNDYDTYMVFNTDETLLYASSMGGTGNLWDTQSCQKLSSLPPAGFEGDILEAYFIGEGQLFIASRVNNDKFLTVWNITSPETPIEAFEFGYDSFDFSDDGSRLARSLDGKVTVYATHNGKSIFTQEVAPDKHIAVTLSPNGNYLLTRIPFRNEMQLWDIDSGNLIRDFFALFERERPHGASFLSNDDETILLIIGNERIELRDAETGELVHSPPKFVNNTIDAFNVDPAGQELLVALDDGTIQQWHIEQNAHITQYKQNIGDFGAFTYSPDSKYIATAPTDGTLRLWVNPSSRPQVEYPSDGFLQVDNDILAIVPLEEDKIGLWDALNNTLTAFPLDDCQEATLTYYYVVSDHWVITEHDSLDVPNCDITGSLLWDIAIAPPELVWFGADIFLYELGLPPTVSPDGRWIASIADPFLSTALEDDLFFDETDPTYIVNIWGTTTNEQPIVVPFEYEPQSVVLHPTQPLIAIVDEFFSIQLWDFADTANLKSTTLLGDNENLGLFLPKLIFDHSGEKLAAVYDDNVVRIWNIADRSLELELVSISYIAFEPGNEFMAVTKAINHKVSAELWDAETYSPVVSTKLNEIDEVLTLEMNTARSRLAIAGSEPAGAILVWNWNKPDEPLVHLTHDTEVTDIAFSDDGEVLFTMTKDGTVHTWILDTDKLIEAACEIVSRPLTSAEWDEYIGNAKYQRATCANQ